MPKLWSDDGLPVEAVDGKPARCPHCCIPAMQSSKAVTPGALVMCAGCATVLRFSDDGRRLTRIEIETLPLEDQARALRAQMQVVEHIRAEGLPGGLHWGTGTLCRPCWEEFAPGKEPCVLKGAPWGTCEFCGCRTDSGIYRRMLVEKPPSESPGAPS
jgi:hypothetical protein